MIFRALAISGLVTLATTAYAGDLEVKEYKGVPYVSGGVGQSEQAAIKEAASNYSLGLTFAGKNGRYVSHVEVTVKDRAGKVVLSAVSDGPVLLADLPAGRYTVEATFQGTTHTRQVSLDENRHRGVVMTWTLPEPTAAAPIDNSKETA